MSDASGAASRRHSRASWVGLRTLRQVPKVVGETIAGDPVFEIRSVRFVLPVDGAHFRRIVTCSRCGEEVPGPAVLSAADLDHPPHAVICKDCVKTVATAGVGDPRGADAVLGNGAGTGRAEPHHTLQTWAEATTGLEDEPGRGPTGSGPGDRGSEELGRAEAEMGLLDVMVERPAKDRGTRSGLQALEERLQRLEETVASQRLELEAGLRRGLAEVRFATTAVATESVSRLRDLEDRADRSGIEVSELGEIQAALDRGLGELRSEVAAVKDANRDAADGQAEVERRLEAVFEAQRVARGEQGRGRGGARRSAVAAQVGVVAAAVEDLVREHQEHRAQVATLTHAADAAAREAARASSQASAVAPLRRDVQALQEVLAAQDDAVVNLSKSVERLQRRISTQAPARNGQRMRRLPAT